MKTSILVLIVLLVSFFARSQALKKDSLSAEDINAGMLSRYVFRYFEGGIIITLYKNHTLILSRTFDAADMAVKSPNKQTYRIYNNWITGFDTVVFRRSKVKLSCSELQGLINFDEVLANFKLNDRTGALILLDKNNHLSDEGCGIIAWGNREVEIMHDKFLAGTIVNRRTHTVVQWQREYFVLDDLKINGNYYTFTLLRPYSHEIMNCKVLRSNDTYKLVWFKGGKFE